MRYAGSLSEAVLRGSNDIRSLAQSQRHRCLDLLSRAWRQGRRRGAPVDPGRGTRGPRCGRFATRIRRPGRNALGQDATESARSARAPQTKQSVKALFATTGLTPTANFRIELEPAIGRQV